MMRIGAIDQGTTSTRILCTEADGSAQIIHAVRHRQIYPREGWVEHDPRELLENIRACIAAVGQVDAFGLGNQGESCLAWDRVTREPLSQVIVWQDNRTSGVIEAMRQRGAEEVTLSLSGLPLDPYFSASKLAWLLENIPAVCEAHRAGRLCLGTTDAWFRHCLTGRFETDATTASRTGLMDIESRSWHPGLCALFGVPVDCLPAIGLTAGAVLGEIAGVPLTASVVDQQAALYGHGCRQPGDAKMTFGTGAFAMAVTGETPPGRNSSGLLPTVAWALPEATTYALDGGVYDAGTVIEWLRRLGMITDPAADLQEFAASAAISRGLAFVPALSGLGCPHWDRSAAALWIGMTAATSSKDLLQAALEGVALSAQQVLAALSAETGRRLTVSIDGGLSTNSYFTGFLAEIADCDLSVNLFTETTSFGCAALAGLALGQNLPCGVGRERLYGKAEPAGGLALLERFSLALGRSAGWHVLRPE